MLLIQKKIEVRFGNSLEGLITEKKPGSRNNKQ